MSKPDTTQTIDGIVERVYLYGMNGGLGYGKFEDELSPKEAKTAIQKLIAEVIGEDEPAPAIPQNDYYWRFRNELRAKQRQRAKERGLL